MTKFVVIRDARETDLQKKVNEFISDKKKVISISITVSPFELAPNILIAGITYEE